MISVGTFQVAISYVSVASIALEISGKAYDLRPPWPRRRIVGIIQVMFVPISNR